MSEKGLGAADAAKCPAHGNEEPCIVCEQNREETAATSAAAEILAVAACRLRGHRMEAFWDSLGTRRCERCGKTDYL